MTRCKKPKVTGKGPFFDVRRPALLMSDNKMNLKNFGKTPTSKEVCKKF